MNVVQKCIINSSIMTMNGLMNKYKESLKNIPKPVMPSEVPKIKIELKELLAYSKLKNVSPIDLTDDEKEKFIKTSG